MVLSIRGTLMGLALAASILPAVPARAESAAEEFAEGKALLAEGDFRGALASYATAARADRSNRKYLQQYMMVRRIIEMRRRLDVEKDEQRWEYLARALRSFYVSERIYSEALAVDRKMHARLKTASSAAMLAETQLSMGLHAEAIQTLGALAPDKRTASTGALLGIALARAGKTHEAKQIAGTVTLPKNAGPGMTYAVARMYAVTGDTAKALGLLKNCFERVPPGRLDGFKTHARLCPAFADLVSTAEFAAVLQTKSKVPQSKCSGGSSCAGCPMRGKCSQGNDR